VDPPELDLELVEEPAVIDAIEKIASNTAQIEVLPDFLRQPPSFG